MAAERTVTVRIKAEYRAFEADMKAAARAAKQAAEETEKAGKKSSSAMGRLLLDAKNNEQSWQTAGNTMMGFGASVVAMVGLSVAKYAEFEKAMSRVEAATHESAGNMDLLRDAAIRAGADTAFSAAEAAGAIEELAKAGVSTADILGGGLDGALSLAAAGELAVADAAEIAASALTQFKLSGDQIPHLADLLAAGAGKAQGSVADLGAALNQSGLVAAQTGLSVEETTGALAAFAAAGLTGSDAGTSFKTMLQSLSPNSDKAAGLIDELGISAYDAQGRFIGMSEYAGLLQDALKDMSAEQRNATLKTIFGSDAVRAASVIYEQGAAGIEKWETAVNSAGFAALTASINQDNLLGDIEKLGGSFDTVFIKGGKGVSTALRGIVQGAEDVVDVVGKIPEPVLSTGFAVAGIVGVSALAAGGLMRLVPAAIETVTAFQSLGTQGGKVPGTLGKITKVAGIAGIALAGVAVAAQILGHREIKTTTDYAQAMMRVAEAGEKASSRDLDSVFRGWDGMLGKGPQIDSLAQSIERISNPKFGDGLNNWADDMFAWTGWAKSDVGQVEDRLSDLSDEMGSLVDSGNADAAAASFRVLAAEFEANGQSAQTALNSLPGYKDALVQVATNAGVAMTAQELMNYAITGTPPAAVAAAGAADELSVALEEAGVEADGAVQSLDKFMESLFALGEGTASVAAAKRNFKDSMREVTESIKENGTSLNTNTEQGSENEAMLYDLGEAARAQAEAMAMAVDENGKYVYTQGDVQKSLSGSYDSVLKQVEAFGLEGQAARDMARDIMGIPDGVSVDTWMSDQAKKTAEATTEQVNRIPEMKGVKVIVTEDGTVAVTAAKIQDIRDRTVSTTVTDEGTIMEVQGGINGVSGKNEFILVSDDGTVQTVQARINRTTGKTEYVRVTDDGTVAGVQGRINSLKGKTVSVNVSVTRSETIKQRVQRQIEPFSGSYFGGPQAAKGRRMPGLTFGGRLPTTGLGTDKILGVNSDGTPLAWVDDKEWVVNRRSSDKHNGLLAAINRDDSSAIRSFAGLSGLAGGGRLGWADDQKASAARELERARAGAVRARKSKSEKDDSAAEKRLDRAEKRYEEARDRRARLASQSFDLSRDLKRGNIRESFTSGSGMSVVDQMFEQSRNTDLSKKQRSNLKGQAFSFEAQLMSLEKKANRLTKALDKARDSRDELRSVVNNVRGAVEGTFDLGAMVGQEDAYGYKTPVTKKTLLAAGREKAASAKKLHSKIKGLQKKGFGPELIQQAIDEWTSSGTFELADAMLSMTKSEANALDASFDSVSAYGRSTGFRLTEAMQKGGLHAAEGLVAGLYSREKAVESAFYNLGKQAEKAFKRSLGIKSPSRVMMGAADDTVDGYTIQLGNRQSDVDAAMGTLVSVPRSGVPESPEVARYGASRTAASSGIDYNQLAAAMANVQLHAKLQVNGRQAGTLVQEGRRFANNH